MTVQAARALLAALSDRGIKVEAISEDKLRYAPRSEIDTLTLMQLRLHKQTLLSILVGIPTKESPAEEVPRFVQRELERASELGLAARWSREYSYIGLHDPTTGEWHDIPTKDASKWAKWEAGKRKELHRGGDRRAYDLRASQMGEIWAEEHPGDPFADRGI